MRYDLVVSLAHWFLPAQGRLSLEDVGVLARLLPALSARFAVGLLHPARHELRALPKLAAISARQWDLRWRSPKPHQALIAGRMLGFSAADSAPFQNALASCRLLIVLGSGPESPRLLGEARLANASLRVYRGDFTDPLLRVDDYPTGVRPILEDLSSIHDVLSLIDDAGLPFHLGIVPSILEERMLPFLRGLSQLVVSQHGVEHGYAKHSKILIDAADPNNQRGTVSGFDEFAGQPYTEILEKLRMGRQSLEARLGQTPLSYIPPCNASNRNTGRALEASGFCYILSEKPVAGCDLPVIGSDFYDRSSAFKFGSRPNVASLHVTWEADMLRAGDSESLPKFLSALVEQRARAREEAASVAERIVSTLARG
jgi:hypothetical protein